MCNRVKYLLIVSFLMLLLSACAARTFQNNGEKFLQSKEYCQAMNEYGSALKIKPIATWNKKDAENSALARRECAITFYQKGMSLAEKVFLLEAIKEFKTAVSIDPENNAAKEVLEATINKKAENDKKAEDHYKAGAQFVSVKDWQNAFTEYKASLELNPQGPYAADIAKVEAELRNAEDLYAAAMSDFKEKNWVKSLEGFDKALKASPLHTKAQERTAEAKAEMRTAVDLFSMGEKLLSQKALKEAENKFTESLTHDPGLLKAKEALVGILYKKAVNYENDGSYGSALVNYLKAQAVLAQFKDVKEKIPALEEKIKKRTVYKVALIPFRDFPKEKGLSQSFFDKIISSVSAQKPEGVEIIEADTLNGMLTTQKISADSLDASKESRSLNGIKGVDSVITGKLLDYKITASVTKEAKQQRYQSGSRQVYNPDYNAAVQNVNSAQSNYNQARQQKGWGGVILAGVAGGILEAAKSKLANTPQYLEEPIYSNWHYKVHNHTKKAVIKVSCSLVDVKTGVTTYNEVMDDNVVVKDYLVENANPDAGVKDHELEIASDEDLKESIVDKGSKKLLDSLRAAMSNYGYSYYLLAEKAKVQGKNKEMVENYVNFIYTIPAHGKFDDKIKEVSALIGYQK